MASRRVVAARSAGSNSEKRNVLVQECLRRLRNCGPNQPWAVKVHFMNQLMLDMKHAGHSEHFREIVAIKAISKYKAQVEDSVQGKKPLYRSRAEIKESEAERGGKARKDDWFRVDGYTSTLNVLPTPGSKLARQTADAMKRCPPPEGTKSKIQERGGSTVQRQLVRSNPFPREECGREDCGMCAQKASKGMCYKSNVGYSYVCNRCEFARNQQMERGATDEQTTAYKYIGETGRTPYTRHLWHMSKYRSKYRNQDNRQPSQEEEEEVGGTFMWSHARDHHGGSLGPDEGAKDFKMEFEGSFRDPMSRQVDEAVRMRLCGCELMNGKGEYYQPKTVQTIFKQL